MQAPSGISIRSLFVFHVSESRLDFWTGERLDIHLNVPYQKSSSMNSRITSGLVVDLRILACDCLKMPSVVNRIFLHSLDVG